MTIPSSLAYYAPEVEKADVYTLSLVLAKTGVTPSFSPAQPLGNAMTAFWSPLSNQAEIDDFLGTTDEFLFTQFGATSMATDGVGILIKTGGQCADVHAFTMMALNQKGAPGVGEPLKGLGAKVSAISDVANNQIAVGAEGNIALIGRAAGMEALDPATIILDIYWSPK